jgi:L-rhamnose isomerase
MWKAVPENRIEKSYAEAKAVYAEFFGIDTDAAIKKALDLPISLHCWQADDVAGFEVKPGGLAGGGIMATGNYPGRARNGNEVRQDMAKAMELIPGKTRANVHASYCETNGKFVERDQLAADHFKNWIDWAGEKGIGLDFNPTAYAHPKAQDGFTLSHADSKVREFWIRHFIACRKIAQAMAEALGTPCLVNHWIPDGAKDMPADRWSPRARLAESYDRIFSKETGVDPKKCVDFVESKLFGIGSEEYVVGSSEFFSSYALSRKIGLCMDMGHYHPTETIHDKISAHLQFHKKLLLHVSRPIRWDSDHVVIFNDDLKNVFLEIQRGSAWNRVALALDFFDASINRIGAYVIGTRAARKGILFALLDPTAQLQKLEAEGRNAQRLGLMEECKSLPFAAVWDMLCLKAGVPAGTAWMAEMESYETKVLAKRK